MGCLGSGGNTKRCQFGKSSWANADYIDTLGVILKHTCNWAQLLIYIQAWCRLAHTHLKEMLLHMQDNPYLYWKRLTLYVVPFCLCLFTFFCVLNFQTDAVSELTNWKLHKPVFSLKNKECFDTTHIVVRWWCMFGIISINTVGKTGVCVLCS